MMSTHSANGTSTPPEKSTAIPEKAIADIGHLEYSPPLNADAAAVDHEDAHEGHSPHIHLKTWLVLFAINVLNFAELMNVVGSAAFSRNVAAVVGDSGKAIWLNAAITTCTAVLGPITSQASDLWGRKVFVVAAGTLGFIGSLVTGRASSMNMAIAGQVISGLNYGAQPLTYAIPSEIVHRKYRTSANAGVNIAGAAGAIVGLLMGGGLMRHDDSHFRTFYYIAAGLYGISALTCAFLYNPTKRPLQIELTTAQKLKKLDWVGEILLGGSLALLVMGFTWAENPYSWKSGHVLGTIVTGLVLAILLAVHQIWIRKDGLLDHRLWSQSRTPAVTIVALALDGLIFNTITNYLPQQAGILFTQDGLFVVMHLAVIFFSTMVLAPVVGYVGTRFKRQREISAIGFIGFCAMGAAMSTATVSSGNATYGYAVLGGLGLACGITSLTTAAQLTVPADLIAPVTGLSIAFRSGGGAIGAGIATAIFNSKTNALIGPSVAAAVLPLGLPAEELGAFIGLLASGNIPAVLALPGVTPQILGAGGAALKGAFVSAFKNVWIYVAATSAAGVLTIKEDKSQYTSRIDAPVEKESELYEIPTRA